jgi:hypothetical protein
MDRILWLATTAACGNLSDVNDSIQLELMESIRTNVLEWGSNSSNAL